MTAEGRGRLFRDMVGKLIAPNLSNAPFVHGYAPKSQHSVLFATVLNAHEGMTCMSIDPEVRCIAGGFRDNMVRVWTLDNDRNEDEGEADVDNITETNRSSSSHDNNNSNTRNRSNKNNNVNKEGKQGALELIGHSGSIFDVDFHLGGRLVFSGAGDETIRLWDTKLARSGYGSGCVSVYPAPSAVFGIKVSPLGHYFLAGCQDGSASLYSTDRNHRLRVYSGHVSDVNAVDWHPSCMLVASASEDRSCRLWDMRTARSVRWLRGPTKGLSSINLLDIKQLLGSVCLPVCLYVSSK